MKNLAKITLLMFLTIFVVSCNKDTGNELLESNKLLSNEDFIDQELKEYKGDLDVTSLKQALMSFDQTTKLAFDSKLSDESEIGNMFIQNVKERGGRIVTSEFAARNSIPEVPKELLEILNELVKTTNVTSIDEYILNLKNFEGIVKNSSLKLTAKAGLLTSVLFLKITAKLIKRFPPKWLNNETTNQKWVKQLKCAFESLTMGVSGAFTGCLEGSAMVAPIGSAFGGSQGESIGSLTGCSVGAVIKGIIKISTTAKACISREGL